MLLMLLACRSSRIFALRACSSGLRFFLLLISKTSHVVLLFYTTSEVYTNFGMVSLLRLYFSLLSPIYAEIPAFA